MKILKVKWEPDTAGAVGLTINSAPAPRAEFVACDDPPPAQGATKIIIITDASEVCRRSVRM